MRIKTVTINNNGEPLVINATDFRQGSDELWRAEDGPAEEQEDAKDTEAEGQEDELEHAVIKHKGGGRWIVLVNDVQVNNGTLTKSDAQALAAEY